jgi:hypothetical protein
MYQTINRSEFRDAFRAMGRLTQFSYEGLDILFHYLEDNFSDYELDVIALCCDYTEQTIEGIAEDYSIDTEGNDPDSDEYIKIVMDYLEDNTIVVGMTNGDSSVLFAKF